MTPFGRRLRELRREKGRRLKEDMDRLLDRLINAGKLAIEPRKERHATRFLGESAHLVVSLQEIHALDGSHSAARIPRLR